VTTKNKGRRLTTQELSQVLERGLDPLYVIIGEEPLLALEATDLLQKKAREKGFTERKVLTAEPGFDWGDVHGSLGTPSLFGDREQLILRIPTGKPGVEGGRVLESLAQHLHDDILVIVELPAIDFAVQKSKWFVALSEQATLIEARAISRDRLPAFIESRLKRQQQSVSAEGLQFLAEKVEGNLLAAFQEIQKLGLLFPVGLIPDNALKSAVMDVARFDLDDLSDALMKKDAPRYYRTLQGLEDGGEALPLIVWSLAETLRGSLRTLQSRQAGRSLSEALREARVWGPRQKLLESTLSSHRLKTVEAALFKVAQVDRAAKGMEFKADPWELLRQLGIDFFR
jgi:DNA polymerase-3 subunit delta